MFLKHRVEALSDGIFAIAMTLLILDIKVPLGNDGPLSAALAKESHAWISFAISFLLAGIFWMHQHRVFEAATAWTKPNLLLTFVFLAGVCTLPFSTSLWGHHLRDPLALAIYFGNQFMLGLVLSIQLVVIAAKGHVNREAHQPIEELRWRLAGITVAFAVAMMVATFSVADSGLAAALVIVTSRLVGRKLHPKSRAGVEKHA